ncbi:MAG: TIGR00730 family Rossman fold protein [Armatimonadota bacterium]|nr:TIGR00730 family Rossman fold protein [Armatimonadota bacterium]MDR7452966.1 TIGR00730 family Rossman fold protein [Armatimonadota bacterium]MDR7456366.1 TIGR00730 family Rossman fold protein [Armatimonadota bacterium]MDR7496715.1 TIGR00730 family Rossman fold protein [Armatimonadota bacterium]MDR7511194.1 TIGR00730 family Rossman fold protein [Armatimonadota bacterium]
MKRVCVFCGASPGLRPVYAEAARTLGYLLVSRGAGLVFGGGRVGLMGVVADAVLAAGGEAVGVIPRALVAKEVAHEGLTALHVVDTMHERKALMVDLADGFVALPGGVGTLDELSEVLSWAQLGLHRKPCGVLNVDGYFDALLAMLDRGVADGFIRAEDRAFLLVDDAPALLLDRMSAHRPAPVPRWVRREEV